MAKNITYLFGAGASANTIPVVANMHQRISEIRTTLKNKESEILNNTRRRSTSFYPENLQQNVVHLKNIIGKLDWLLINSGEFYTIDTLAKKFYLEGNNTSYYNLKESLILYFTLEQILYIPSENVKGYDFVKKTSDLRYSSFISAIASRRDRKLILNNNIKILSWNYDVQFELALKQFVGPENSISQMTKEYQIFPQINSERSSNTFSKERFSLQKLNGHAIFPSNTATYSTSTIFDSLYKSDDINNRLGIFLENYKTLSNKVADYCKSFSFAWENSQDFINEFNDKTDIRYKTNLKQAIQIAKHTEILVVVGYSFPVFNREIDNMIISSMEGTLKKVYIQDQSPNRIESTMRNAFEILQPRETLHPQNTRPNYIPAPAFHLETSLNQFLIPFEMMQ